MVLAWFLVFTLRNFDWSIGKLNSRFDSVKIYQSNNSSMEDSNFIKFKCVVIMNY